MKSYIFDLDGTLLDSMGVWVDVDTKFLKKRGIEVPHDYSDAVSSLSFPEAADYTIKRFGLINTINELLQEWNSLAAHAYANTVQMKPFAKEYLYALRKQGAKLAIATSAIPELYEPALRNNGIYDWFDCICNAKDVGCGKTRPDVFLLAASKLGVPPQDCVVFEDILPAVKSAKSVGMTVCGVYDKFSHNDWEEIKQIADHSIICFEALLPAASVI